MRFTAWHTALGLSAAAHALAFAALPGGPHTWPAGEDAAVRPLVLTVVSAARQAPVQRAPQRVTATVSPALKPEMLSTESESNALPPPPPPDRIAWQKQFTTASAHSGPTHADVPGPSVITEMVESAERSLGATIDSAPARPVGGVNAPPRYPLQARRNGWHGTTLLEVDVAANGRVRHIRIARSSGHGVLDAAARSAVARWQFNPAQTGGLRLASTVRLPVVFRLESSRE